MIKQVVLFKKRPDMTVQEFVDYYENQHSQLARRMSWGKSSLPNAVRYVRRYITPVKNPLTGELLHPGYDCIMEIWWNSKEDFEAAMRGLADPEKLPIRLEDERRLFATNSNPGCIVEEYDSPVGPENLVYEWIPKAVV
jgi:hypothetical protein